MKILIVDDDSRRRESLVEYLVQHNVTTRDEIAEVDCADAAKIALSVSYFDVLVLDVVLPKRSKEVGDPKYGLALLGQITRSSRFHKPEKVIGITAHLDDIDTFRIEFNRHCLAVIEANPNTTAWKSDLVGSLSYTARSKLSRAVSASSVHALTVHGIRTFGAWQNRLRILVHQQVSPVPFHSYKYGYFSALAFFIPWIRSREVSRLEKHLRELFKENLGNDFIIFSHSFGTYLITHALQELSKDGSLPIKTLVFCGSVLRHDHNWSTLHRAGVRIVNDCADNDFVLWLSEMFVPGTGMAGKRGFYGFLNDRLTNRYFQGGHSTYFKGDRFMELYWLPLFDTNQLVAEMDCRQPSPIMHEFIDKIVSGIGAVKRSIGRGVDLLCTWFSFVTRR